MKKICGAITILILLGLILPGCKRILQRTDNIPPALVPSASPSPVTQAEAMPVTLPVLDALFADEQFTAELKSRLYLTDEQISELKRIASDEVARLRKTNAEEHSGSPAEARDRAAQLIHEIVGKQKADELAALVREHWIKGSEELEVSSTKEPEITMLSGPNAVPTDTRVVVNIPAYRMDVFGNGELLKSYKIGIGYPEFPLPTGLRKAQTIIFNPTWTPPDSPWVASMKDITPGEKVEAGSKLNPLGPIKIPIGMPSLIHGGKPLSKLGTFASHGCVGLTNAQVKDFAKLLIRLGTAEISDQTIATYSKNKTKTKVVKLDHVVPVELRYETIVVEDGKLHIYRDVYDQDTNTEKNLRAVLEANGTRLEELAREERMQAIEALNAMSLHPKKETTAATDRGNPNSSPTTSSNHAAESGGKKAPAERDKSATKRQREIVVEIKVLKGKGYPGPRDLDTGTGKPASVTTPVSMGF